MSTVHTLGDPAAIGAGDRELVEGDAVGEYVIRDQLGKGGFGTVYRAVQPVIGKQVAIKVLSRRYSSDDAIVSRFVAEARAVNQIRHRNIIDIFSFGQLPDGRHYYVMEYLDGLPLDRHLREQGVLRIESALPILRAIARALDAAHAKGIAHRDLKPENIVLSFDDEGQIYPKLLDFGIAKLTSPDEEQTHRTGTGVPLGTPHYMSPEQCRGRDVDHRTDIYSFGVLSFRLLTGDYPFHGELIEILHKHMHEDPPRPSAINPALTAEIDHAITWMLQKDPVQRPATVMAAVFALQGESTAPTPMFPTTVARRTPVPGRDGVQTADTMAASVDTLGAPATSNPMAAGRSRPPLWIGAAVVIAGAIATFAWIQTRPASAPTPPVTAGSAPAPVTPVVVPATAPADAPEAPDAPPVAKSVIVRITGAPDGAVVKKGTTTVGVTPTVQLDRGSDEVVLSFFLDGYLPASLTVRPDEDQTAEVLMKKKPRPKLDPRPSEINPDDLADPFKKKR
ncbi:MAG: protein kinase [Deltaproteobacteria bacterium]|nr:protein kinase [Deltaproteobacteria bacterium]